MGTNTLGKFKLHDSAKGIKKHRTKAEMTALCNDIVSYIETHPKATREDVVIRFDLTESMSYIILGRLVKQGRLYTVSKSPARYRAHAPVLVKQANKWIDTSIKQMVMPSSSDGVDTLNQNKIAEPVEAVNRQVPKDTFIEQLDNWFIRYADRAPIGLAGANEFRAFIKKKMGEN